MRHFAVAATLLGVLMGSTALADPFERLPGRLQHYQEEIDEGGMLETVPGAEGVAEEAEVLPTPMGYPEEDLGFYPEPGGWQEPMMAGCAEDMCCRTCTSWGTFWGRAEYMVWWTKGAFVPALVTTSPSGTPVGQAGVLPDATTLFGNGVINTAAVSGGRFTLGYWFDPCRTLGIEDSFFFVGSGHQSYFANSSGLPILARPFFNTNTQAQDSVVLAYPQVTLGSINITSSRNIVSNEVNLRRGLMFNCCSRFDVLLGYRFFHIAEGLNIRTDTTAQQNSPFQSGTNFVVQDLFNTRANFNGGQLGFNYQRTWGCWTVDTVFKLALGGINQRAAINGSTVRTIPNQTAQTFQGGILALPSNIGTFNRTRFSTMPEFDLNLRYQWSPLWTFSIGYTLIGVTNVVRPGDQIDLNLDPAQFPPGTTGTSPAFAFRDSDLWLQAINFGIECDF